MSVLRKRARPLAVSKRGSNYLASTSPATASLRLGVILSLCFLSTILLHHKLTQSSQQRDLTHRDHSNPVNPWMRRSFSERMSMNERYNIVFYEPDNHTEILIRDDYATWRKAFLKSIDDPNLEEQYDPDEDVSVQCRRTNWARTVHSTCHVFHEIAMDIALYQEQVEHLGTGTYRDAWWFRPANVVYKTSILADPELQSVHSDPHRCQYHGGIDSIKSNNRYLWVLWFVCHDGEFRRHCPFGFTGW